jgi:hypothetical protein
MLQSFVENGLSRLRVTFYLWPLFLQWLHNLGIKNWWASRPSTNVLTRRLYLRNNMLIWNNNKRRKRRKWKIVKFDEEEVKFEPELTKPRNKNSLDNQYLLSPPESLLTESSPTSSPVISISLSHNESNYNTIYIWEYFSQPFMAQNLSKILLNSTHSHIAYIF